LGRFFADSPASAGISINHDKMSTAVDILCKTYL
jgi:hypothetical protein